MIQVQRERFRGNIWQQPSLPQQIQNGKNPKRPGQSNGVLQHGHPELDKGIQEKVQLDCQRHGLPANGQRKDLRRHEP